MKILIVGGTGFIGRNLKEFFLTKKSFKIFYPTRQELNLFDDNACRDYLKKIKPDIVIHSAVDILSVENSLKIFFNIFNNHQFFGHLIQVGSGAEYDKRFYKPKMVESDFSLSVPIDTYGLAKFHIANVLETQKEKKYTNLRIFGIFGKYEDHSRRFISNNICRVLVGLPISLNRDMFFDYIWVQDFCLFIEKLIGFLPLKDISYNFCSGNPVSLLSLAKIIKTQMEVEGEIIIKDQVKILNIQAIQKIFNELEKFNFTDHKLAIENLINHYKKNLDRNRLKLLENQSMNRKEIFLQLRNKKVLIWGARMTGIGALRQLKAENIKVQGFIDSDLAFKNKTSNNLPIYNPADLKDLFHNKNNNYVILIAVALKEEEILRQLKSINLNYLPRIISYSDNSPYYTIDILGSCNLRCASCPHSIEDSDVPKGSMRLEIFKEVFDKIINDSKNVSHISLYSWGEPLLHPYLDQIIEYVHKKNVAVALSSNLSINFDKRLNNIIKSSPDYLKISLSGYYPKAYNNTHQGGDINLVKSNLYQLRYLIDKYKVNTLVDINYHLYRDNAGENLEKIESLANELNFIVSKTYALVMPLERVINHIDGKTDSQTAELQKNLLVTIDEGIKASSNVKLPKNTCPFRENQININADLTVPVCCTVWDRGDNIVSNNYLQSSIDEINNKKKTINICDKCMQNNLPEYNMGFNRNAWDEYAKKKKLCDIGILGKENNSEHEFISVQEIK